jgi:M6 family metalloprotease-like protein
MNRVSRATIRFAATYLVGILVLIALPGHLVQGASLREKDRASEITYFEGGSVPKKGDVSNLVVFIRFKDQAEFTTPFSFYDRWFNDSSAGAQSLYSYYKEVSYNKLRVRSHFVPQPQSAAVVSYVDQYPYGYYLPYNASTNPLGYPYYDFVRFDSLNIRALQGISSQLPPGINFDLNNDGAFDHVCFVFQADVNYGQGFSPSEGAGTLLPDLIAGKSLGDYMTLNTYIQSGFWDYQGLLCHEFFHGLGAVDLYVYAPVSKQPELDPVDWWDNMAGAFSGRLPHVTTYMKFKYGNWIDSIPRITASGTYSLKPVTSPTSNAFRIDSPNSIDEYYMIEYRKKIAPFESTLVDQGLLVYRVKENARPPGSVWVYVYRPGGNGGDYGEIARALLSADNGRTAINDTTDPNCHLSGFAAGGLSIYDVGHCDSTITFKVQISGARTSPRLLAPVDSTTVADVKPKFVWTRVGGAISYRVMVSDTTSFSRVIANVEGLVDTNLAAVDSLLFQHKYYWKVGAQSASGFMYWSTVGSFNTEYGLGPYSAYVSPLQHYANTSEIYFPYFVGDTTEAYIHFQTPSLAPGARVVDAQIRFYVMGMSNAFAGSKCGVFDVQEKWNPTFVAWNSRPGHATTPSATLDLYQIQGDWVSIPGLGPLAARWVNDPTSNNGVVLGPIGPVGNWLLVYGFSNPDTARRPKLVLQIDQTGVGTQLTETPLDFFLGQNYPNPFNPTTVIGYQLPVASMVRITICDVLGREVAVPVNEKKEPGSYEVKFDGTGLSSGVYFYRMQAGDYVQTRRLMLLR